MTDFVPKKLIGRRLPIIIIALLLSCAKGFAQMPNDAIYMNKKEACLALSYSHSAWTKYWEDTLKRENLNIGKHTTQAVMPMIAIGITNDFNVLVGAPFIWTQASAGNLKWQKGIQDLSVWLKYRFLNKNGFSLHAIGGGSLPLTNYIPDFLPMSIGVQCKTATARLMASYRHQSSGIYATASGSYIFRSNIEIDRDSYQAGDQLYDTHEVSVPNAYDFSARVGYLKKGIQGEVFFERNGCDGGDNIRRNDMPFPTNNMKASVIGAYAKYQPKKIGVNARVSYVTRGANVGQSTAFSVGVLYQFSYMKSKQENI